MKERAVRKYPLFFAFALICVGAFVLIIGLGGEETPYSRDELKEFHSELVEDANNVGPRYRTFKTSEFGGRPVYLTDLLLNGTTGPQFSNMMRMGTRVDFHVKISDLEKLEAGKRAYVHAVGLVANGETIVDVDAVIADQGPAQSRRKFAYGMVGGIMLLGGILFGFSKYKRIPPRAERPQP
jgi:hypothetical protein